MSEISNNDILRSAAKRASDKPFFMAGVLGVFLAKRGIDEEALAIWLECPLEQINRLALCRRPDADSTSFRHDIESIAVYVGASAIRLAEMLREVDAWTALRTGLAPADEGKNSGLLMAARDREVPAEIADSVEPDSSEEQDHNA